MEPSITPTKNRQLFLYRAGILGSALLIGAGIFMYAGQTTSPRDLRADVLSPEQLTASELEMMTASNPYLMETEDELLGTTSDASFDQDAFLEELLRDPAAPTGQVDGTDYLEGATATEDTQAKIAYQAMQKEQLRATTAQYWTEQDAMNASLRPAAGAFDDFVDPTAMGGGASDLSTQTPSEMPKSGPGLLLVGAASLGAAAVLRRRG